MFECNQEDCRQNLVLLNFHLRHVAKGKILWTLPDLLRTPSSTPDSSLSSGLLLTPPSPPDPSVSSGPPSPPTPPPLPIEVVLRSLSNSRFQLCTVTVRGKCELQGKMPSETRFFRVWHSAQQKISAKLFKPPAPRSSLKDRPYDPSKENLNSIQDGSAKFQKSHRNRRTMCAVDDNLK